MAGFRDSIVEIKEEALQSNLAFFKSLLKPSQGIILVLKANSYGAGCTHVAHMFDNDSRVEFFAVASIDEGIELRVAGIRKRIMILNMDIDLFDHTMEYNLEPVIISQLHLERFLDELAGRPNDKKSLAIHVNFDTGMHRVGFNANEIKLLAETLNANPNLLVETVYSHYVNSGDSSYDDYSMQQLDNFTAWTKELIDLIGYRPKLHMANSGGAERFSNEGLDLVRIGIGLYGISVNDNKLENAFTWKAKVEHIQTLEKGESVSYNHHWTASKKSTIATVFVGYADGLNRRLSNGKWSLQKGENKLPIVGDICMDLCMVDATDVDINIGDELEILNSIDGIENMAESLETISYEVLTGISPRIQRDYF